MKPIDTTLFGPDQPDAQFGPGQQDGAPTAPAVGGGRGFVNPPSAIRRNPNGPMTPEEEAVARERLAPAGAFIEGAARGVTMNTFDYVPAAMATVVDKGFRGSNLSWGETFDQMLAAARSRADDIRLKYPKASLAGEVAGAVYTGVRALPAAATAIAPGAMAAGSIPVNAALQAAQGAVSTYAGSADASLTDAGKSAMLQAGLSSIFGGAGRLVAAGREKLAMKTMQQEVLQTPAASAKAAADAAAAGKPPGRWTSPEEFYKSLPPAEQQKIAGAASQMLPTVGQQAKTTAGNIMSTVKGAAMGAPMGFALNEISGLLTGHQMDPTTALLSGVGLGGVGGMMQRGAYEAAKTAARKAALSPKLAGAAATVYPAVSRGVASTTSVGKNRGANQETQRDDQLGPEPIDATLFAPDN